MRPLFIFLLFLPLISFSQLSDDFSDGNFTTNPAWQGDQGLFKINTSLLLQLNQLNPRPDLADTAYLSSSFGLSDSLEWNFSIRLAFSPSDNNNARVYLTADQSDITQSLNGYFLQFGEAGSDDALELFRQEGTEIQSICRGTNGRIASAFDCNVKIIHTKEGEWSVLVDWNKNGNFVPECSGQHLSEINNPYFGFFCKFTPSNATKFYFDNINVNHIYKDTEAPQIENIEALTANELNLQFNEALDTNSAENIQNYQIQESGQIPSSAILNPTNPSEVLLVFDTNFPTNQSLSLQINNIKDLLGNTLQSASYAFFFSRAVYGDVLIHEIMADPYPVQGLPEAEYLELYNQTDYPILLTDWHLFNGSSDFQFPALEIPAKSFLLLAHPDKVDDLANYGSVLAIPSFGLTNSGKTLVLKNKSGQIIHYISYTDNWYKDDFKEEGGWSLEMISTDDFCEQAINWSASQNPKGGSPGSANSLDNVHPDYQTPIIEAIDIIGINTLLLHFSKSMDSLTLKNPQNYSADNNLGVPLEAKIFAPEYNLAEIRFANSFAEETIYQLNLNPEISGCGGSGLQELTARFAIPQEPEFGDIVINEILFDAWLDDGEYVELFNRSDKVIDLRQLLFSRINPDIYDTTYYSVQPNEGQIFPNEYLLLCKNKASVLEVYYSENPNLIYAFDNFPLLLNTKGHVLLSKASDKSSVIDVFSYHEDMHHPLLNNTSGVSLERLSPEGKTNDLKNWQSAAAIVNYGTPAYQNSQFQTASHTEDIIQISPEIFSPDLDGFDDILQINYQFSESGNTINLIIYNAQGQRVRHLVKNDLAGLNGQIFWDGTTEEGDKAPLGIYIIYFEYFNLSGKVEKIKKTCVLGGKL